MAKIERKLVGISNTLLLTDFDGGDTLPPAKYTAAESFLIGEKKYNFLFWTVDGQPNLVNPGAKTINISGGHSLGTKWYLQAGDGRPGETHVAIYAFSMSQNKILTASPIAQLKPVESLKGNAVATSSAAVEIIAKDSLDGKGEPLHHWWWTGMTGQLQIGDPVLNLPQNATGMALAFFGQPKSEPVEVDRIRTPSTMSEVWRYLPVLAMVLDLPRPSDKEFADVQQMLDKQTQALAGFQQRMEQLERRVQSTGGRGG
jgi:hypothetical protein